MDTAGEAGIKSMNLSNNIPRSEVYLTEGTDFLLIGYEQQRKKYSSRFPVTLMGIVEKLICNCQKSGSCFDQNFNFRKPISQVFQLLLLPHS